MGGRKTIREVAKVAGFSVSTTSYALRNDPRVAEESRTKIQGTAKELGYEVSSTVSNWMRAIRQGSEVVDREVLAYIVTKVHNRENLAAKGFYDGGRKRAREHGYKLEKFIYDDGEMSERRLSEILKARGIKGVVVGPLKEKSTYFDLDWPSFAAAGFNFFWWDPPVPRVCSDEYAKTVAAVRKAQEYGYRRVSLAVFSGMDFRYQNAMAAAFMYTVQSLGMPYIPPFSCTKDAFKPERFASWFRKAKPDCVLGVHCLHPFFDAIGVRVPEDVGYISLARNQATRESAGLEVDLSLMGAAAVDLVVSQLSRNSFGVPEAPLTTMIGSVWKDGPTLLRQ